MNSRSATPWQLPDGIHELLPGDAWHVEELRRAVIDLARSRHYDLVSPPLVEYLDSLLTGTGETLALETFQFIDQSNGRTLGIRADMTPQVARMDARSLSHETPNRLVYTGSVLRARVDTVNANRSPLQFGAELFGDTEPASDVEIIRLMLDTVMLSGLTSESLVLDLGHVGFYNALVTASSLGEADREAVFDALQRGSRPDVQETLVRIRAADPSAISEPLMKAFAMLLDLHGEPTVLHGAAKALNDLLLASATDNASPQSGNDTRTALDSACQRLMHIVDALADSHPAVQCHVDLAELRGYRYHTGVVFAVLDADGRRLAQGGRYDDVGKAFGTARAATGFSGDLVALASRRQQPPSLGRDSHG